MPDTQAQRGRGLRVAHIGPLPPEYGGRTPGGVATHLRYLVEGLTESGVDVSLLATNVPATPPRERGRGGAAFRLYPHYQPGSLRDWVRPEFLGAVGLRSVVRYGAALATSTLPMLGARRDVLANLLWYRQFLMREQPDVVHVQHPLERHAYAWLVRQFEGWRVPLVVTAHSFFGEHPESQIQSLMAPNLKHAERIIAVSPHVAEQAIQLGADPDRVRVIRSGVDTVRFAPRERGAARTALGLRPETPLVLFVGNLEPRKAVDVLLRAMPDVQRSIPNAVLVVLGSGQSAGADDQEPRLRHLVRRHGLGESVRFTGRVPEAELLQWYAAADVFVLPSSSEAQGIAALEAMACGLPVVASAVGGLLGTIDDGCDGFLVPFGASDTLAERVVRVLRDSALRSALGVAARARVMRDFTWQRAVTDTIAVYRELCPAR